MQAPLPVPSAPPPLTRSGIPPTGPNAFAPVGRPFGTIDEPTSSSYSGSFPQAPAPPAGMAPLAAPLLPQTYGAPLSSPPPPTYLSQPPRPPVFTQSMPPPVLIDVTPRALVVETAGGFCDTIIPRNAQIPCERTRVFATAQDGQQTVRVRVAQGEDPAFRANTYLGEVELGGIRPAARGEVSVSVTFELDADGTLRVHASDTMTGRQASAQLHLMGVAAEADIATMRRRMEQTGSIVSN